MLNLSVRVHQSEARSPELLPGPPCGCRAPKLWAILILLSQATSRELVGLELVLPGLELVPIWDPGTCKAGTSANMLPRWALIYNLL